MTAHELGRIDPFVVILYRFFAFRFVGVAQITLAIDHDQQCFDPVIVSPFHHFAKVFLVFCLVPEELVDVFNGADPKFLFRDLGKVQVIHFATMESAMERPLSQRDIEKAA